MSNLLLEREVRGCTDSGIRSLERTLVLDVVRYPEEKDQTERELSVVRRVMAERGLV